MYIMYIMSYQLLKKVKNMKKRIKVACVAIDQNTIKYVTQLHIGVLDSVLLVDDHHFGHL